MNVSESERKELATETDPAANEAGMPTRGTFLSEGSGVVVRQIA